MQPRKVRRIGCLSWRSRERLRNQVDSVFPGGGNEWTLDQASGEMCHLIFGATSFWAIVVSARFAKLPTSQAFRSYSLYYIIVIARDISWFHVVLERIVLGEHKKRE